jgi:Asp-tRNA(Asn)/Glu-tRNA(Gln) amidotransferase A subunit family amidase
VEAPSAAGARRASRRRSDRGAPRAHRRPRTRSRRVRFIDPDLARAQAKAVDDYRGTGRPVGALHGLAVGVKDIVDTRDMPTENGTPIDAGRRPGRDATVVRRLRAAGAVVIGKTVTTELAYFHAGKTRNPTILERTPGGSSSGSAAAVAAGMVPLAIGTQTNGSVIRPASFCGVVGFKPTHGLIPRTGILRQSPSARYGRRLRPDGRGCAALLVDALAGHDPADTDTRLMPPPRLLDVATTEPPLTPSLAFVKTPAWDEAEETTKEGFAELAAALGAACTEVGLPEPFGEARGAQRTLMLAGFARSLGPYYDHGRDRLSAVMREAIEEGRRVTAANYLTALDWRESLNSGLEELFRKYDAIVTPAAPGEAPAGIDSTGSPAFNSLWTLCGVPAVTLPLLQGPNGLPVGVQLVGRRGEDARLLRTARWLVGAVANTD